MPQPSETLARALDAMARTHRNRRQVTPPRDDRVLRALVNDLVAARTAAGMTQMDVAMRMLTSKSAVSRLESGRFTRPTLATIESYARAVDARVEIHVRRRR